jgi:hypothetical protein
MQASSAVLEETCFEPSVSLRQEQISSPDVLELAS